MKITEKGKEILKQATTAVLSVIAYGTCIYCSHKLQEMVGGMTITYGFHPTQFESGSTYSDAVEAIVNSNMTDYYKDAAIGDLKCNQGSNYYRAVISIANNSMNSYHKWQAISKLK